VGVHAEREAAMSTMSRDPAGGVPGAGEGEGAMSVRRHPATSSHNYLAKLGEVALPTARSGVNVARVEHDGWCDFQHGRGFCNCDPVVVLEDAETVLAALPVQGVIH